MTVHIGAKPGEIAETVLMPGDPYRARWAAQTFLTDAVLVNEVRGMLGYSGTWHGHRVTIQGSGMGQPSMAIYAHELMVDFGAKTVIRIGSAGAMQPHIQVRDLVLAQTASHWSMPSSPLFHGLNFAPAADFGLLAAAHAASRVLDTPTHIGGIYSSDAFYDERADLSAQLQRHGCLAVEMETAELYTLAARHKARALAILTISDHILTGEALPADQRERSFGTMVELALTTAFEGERP